MFSSFYIQNTAPFYFMTIFFRGLFYSRKTMLYFYKKLDSSQHRTASGAAFEDNKILNRDI